MNPQRTAFEAWIKAPPYERSVRRYPNDDSKWAWPNQYCDHTVQLAWEAWSEALSGIEEAEVVGFDGQIRTVTLRFTLMPCVAVGEKWMVEPVESIGKIP